MNAARTSKAKFKTRSPGWLRANRIVRGLTEVQVASRLGIGSEHLTSIERNECIDNVSVRQLRQVADKLDCEVMYMLIPRRSFDSPITIAGFTPRLTRVMMRLADGLSNKQIGNEMGICENTVKVHVRKIMLSLGLKSRAQIAVLAHSLLLTSAAATVPAAGAE